MHKEAVEEASHRYSWKLQCVILCQYYTNKSADKRNDTSLSQPVLFSSTLSSTQHRDSASSLLLHTSHLKASAPSLSLARTSAIRPPAGHAAQGNSHSQVRRPRLDLLCFAAAEHFRSCGRDTIAATGVGLFVTSHTCDTIDCVFLNVCAREGEVHGRRTIAAILQWPRAAAAVEQHEYQQRQNQWNSLSS